MGNVTQLKQGNMNGLRRQVNECLENAYRRGFDDGRIDAYEKGLEDGNKIADKDLKEIQDSTFDVAYIKGVEDFENLFVHEHDYEQFFEDTYGSKDPNYNLYDLVAKYGAKKVLGDFKKWQEEKKQAEDEVKEGDIVRFNEKSHVYNIQKDREFLVLHVFKDRNLATILYDNGDTSCVELSLVDKTNRHIDEVAQLLNKLRGEDNGTC